MKKRKAGYLESHHFLADADAAFASLAKSESVV
jgi:hypothetical protein